jgi:N-acetylmuramoyl-L-alanine amidase
VTDLPLREGSDGEAVRDLQHRLGALGFTCGDPPGTFGPSTATAVRAFQKHRGLTTSGTCDGTTWDALVEAGWRLGDRPLYLAPTMLRGDDVADLQRRLSAMGFDAGRVDGIFGPLTERALLEFQRNAGLVADAVCGPATVGALERLGDRHDALIVDVRERERFRCGPRTLAERSIVIAHAGGLDALTAGVARLLTASGATVQIVQHPDGSHQAGQANLIGADLFLSFSLADGGGADGCRFCYYRSPAGWESKGGRLLAELVREAVADLLPCAEDAILPMSVPVLRETRMPAVVLELAPASVVVERTGELTVRVPLALERWVSRFGVDS